MEDISGMVYMNTHLKYILGFRGFFNIGFLLVVEIWHDMQKVSGYNLRSMPWQNNLVASVSIDLVYICPNLWCNHFRETFLFGICFCKFNFSFVLTKNSFLLVITKEDCENPFMKKSGISQIH